MTPPALDPDVVAARLRLMAESISQLGELRGATAADLAREPLRRAAAERLLQVIADLAVDINAHIAVAMSGRAPASGRQSFIDAAEAGAIDIALAERLAPAAGLRNVLVHRYVDIDVGLVVSAVADVVDGFPEYIERVAAFVRNPPRSTDGAS